MHEKVAFQPDSRVRQSPGVTCLVRGMLGTAREPSRVRRRVADPIPALDRPWLPGQQTPEYDGFKRWYMDHERYRSLQGRDDAYKGLQGQHGPAQRVGR